MSSLFRTPPPSPSQFPRAIWIPTGEGEPALYRGTPLEMVQTMAVEMNEATVPATISKLLWALAKHRGLQIRLPGGLSDTQLSTFFVHALLEAGVGRPMGSA